jgi:hypothetical protein
VAAGAKWEYPALLPKLEDPVIVEEGDRSSSMTAWDGLFLDVVAVEEDAAEATEDGFDTEEVVQLPFR